MIKEQSVMEICNKYSIEYSWNGNDIVFSWPDKVSISMEDLWKEIDADWEIFQAQEYARNRKPEYPDIGDQLDDLYHKGAFSDEMAVKIKAVKDAHPKPE